MNCIHICPQIFKRKEHTRPLKTKTKLCVSSMLNLFQKSVTWVSSLLQRGTSCLTNTKFFPVTISNKETETGIMIVYFFSTGKSPTWVKLWWFLISLRSKHVLLMWNTYPMKISKLQLTWPWLYSTSTGHSSILGKSLLLVCSLIECSVKQASSSVCISQTLSYWQYLFYTILIVGSMTKTMHKNLQN